MTNRTNAVRFDPRLLENLVRCADCTHGAAYHHNARCNAGGCTCTKNARTVLQEMLRVDGKRRRDGRYYTLDDHDAIEND